MQFIHRTVGGIGVDFGTSSIKVVELRKAKAGVSLVTYAVAAQPNLLADVRTPDAIARTAVVLRTMLQRAGVSRGAVTAALPVLSVFSTVLELPWMPERELDAAVRFAAKSYVPSPLPDVVLGWTSVGLPMETVPGINPAVIPATPAAASRGVPAQPNVGSWVSGPARGGVAASDAGGSPSVSAEPPAAKVQRPRTRKIQEVFLTAAPRESVARYTAVFERLGIPLAALEVESFPLARSLLRGESRPVLLVDLGDRTTSFSVVDEGTLRINQATDVGGEALTDAIARKLSLQKEDAEQKKRAEGITGADTLSLVAAAVKPVLTEIITRGETVRRLYERKRGRPLGKVVLIGGGAHLPGLAPFWSRVTGLPAELGNPWRGIEVPAALTGRLATLGPAFAVAVGLALRGFEPLR